MEPKILLGRFPDDRFQPVGERHREAVHDVVQLATPVHLDLLKRHLVAMALSERGTQEERRSRFDGKKCCAAMGRGSASEERNKDTCFAGVLISREGHGATAPQRLNRHTGGLAAVNDAEPEALARCNQRSVEQRIGLTLDHQVEGNATG
jgi:hypothetical protein